MGASRERSVEQGDRVREMIRWLAAFEDTELFRTRLEAWARSLWPEGQTSPFQDNEVASAVLASSKHVTARDLSGALIVRASDIQRYVAWLTRGQPLCPGQQAIAVLRRSIAEISSAVWVPAVRLWIEGRGYHELVEFSSPITGELFLARAELSADAERETSLYARQDADPARALEDLFDTLLIDSADTKYERVPAGPARWVIVREEQPGMRVHVAQFNGLAKARARLTELNVTCDDPEHVLELLS